MVHRFGRLVALLAPALVLASGAPAAAQEVRSGAAALGDWRSDAPGVRRKITPADLPPPHATRSASNSARVVKPPAGAMPSVPPGFTVSKFAEGLDHPRLLRVAPNGDVFVAESSADRVRVLRASEGALRTEVGEIFADGLRQPFGIAFYPPGPDPQWVLVANTDSVVRFPYRAGDLKARGKPETIVQDLPGGGRLTGGGHWTRDVAFSNDGARMFVSVGSVSNVAENMTAYDRPELTAFEATHGLGASWGAEEHRADVLEFQPDGRTMRVFATGIRNCVGLAVHPRSGDVWCSTNERDGLGDDLVPDYVTRVRDGAFYGWPWFYIGANEDPRHKGARADLRDKIAVPDVLLQPHSATLQMTFYTGTQFPAEYRGHGFSALHGSWNRAQRTGYKVIRIPVDEKGVPTGEYEDFMTGFVTPDGQVWGRPVGVAVARDGALLVSEDGNGTIWRIAWQGR